MSVGNMCKEYCFDCIGPNCARYSSEPLPLELVKKIDNAYQMHSKKKIFDCVFVVVEKCCRK